MAQNSQKTILEKGYQRLVAEYQQRDLPVPVVQNFGLNPGWNAVIGTHGCSGVAMSFERNNLLYGSDQTWQDEDYLKSLIGRTLFDVAGENIRIPLVSRRSIGLAALNALSQPFLTDEILHEKGFCTMVNLEDYVKSDHTVVIIGYGGLIKTFAGRCQNLHVTDQRPVESFRTTIIGQYVGYGPPGITIHPSEENKEVLGEADVAIITGSTLVNGTYEEVVGYAKHARIRALYGSSAQMIPDVLFESGITVVMSVAINDPATFIHDVMNAPDMERALRKHQRKYTVTCRNLSEGL